MTFDKDTIALVTMLLALLATTNKPAASAWVAKWWKRRQRVPKPLHGETWANSWGLTMEMRGYSEAGDLVLAVSMGSCVEERTVNPEHWTQLVREHTLEKKRA